MESTKDLYKKYHDHKQSEPEMFENNMMRNLESMRKSINNYNSYGLDKKQERKDVKKLTSQSVI